MAAHFASKNGMKAFLDAQQVDALFAKIPTEVSESHFDYTDTLITSKTEIAPAETNDPILVSIANRIVIWFLSGTQQWNDTNKPELDRRENLYNSATKELDAVKSGEIKLPEDTNTDSIDPECGHAYRRTGRY